MFSRVKYFIIDFSRERDERSRVSERISFYFVELFFCQEEFICLHIAIEPGRIHGKSSRSRADGRELWRQFPHDVNQYTYLEAFPRPEENDSHEENSLIYAIPS